METPPSQPGSKVDEYIARVKAGETVESFGEIPESWKEKIQHSLHPAAPEVVASAERSVEEERQIADLRDSIERSFDAPLSLTELSEKLEALSEKYYFLTHQTSASTAMAINQEGFLLQAGGLNTTTLFQGASGIVSSLEKMQEGESHRGSDGMLVMAVPKEEFAHYLPYGRFSPDAFADMLIENKLEEISASGQLRVPVSYNLGTYDKATGFTINQKYR